MIRRVNVDHTHPQYIMATAVHNTRCNSESFVRRGLHCELRATRLIGQTRVMNAWMNGSQEVFKHIYQSVAILATYMIEPSGIEALRGKKVVAVKL